MESREKGFALLTSIWITILILTLALLVQLKSAAHWRLVGGFESQLHSLLMAENGIEYARAVLPGVDINQLLRGQNGVHEGAGEPEWRNPLPFGAARRIDPDQFVSDNDDGIPFHQGNSPLLSGYRSADGGYFFLRFSNNPEETPDQDLDHVVLVRCVGVVPSRIRSPFFLDLRNDVTLVEARLRQEVSFLPPSPLTLFGDAGHFIWDGTSFSIASSHEPGVSVVAYRSPQLYTDFLKSLSPVQATRIQGQGTSPSIQDATVGYNARPVYQVLFRAQFWKHFLEHLPDYTNDRIRFLAQGGEWNGDLSGVLVTVGDTRLGSQTRVRGLVMHLGEGTLILEDQAEIMGAVWMSNLMVTNGDLVSQPLSLQVSGSASIQYDTEAIQEAVANFPPTLLGWRILFPEMQL